MYNPKKKQSARVDRIAVRIDVRNVLRHHGMEWEKMKDDSWNDRGRKIWRFFLKRFCIQFVQKKKKKQGILRTKSRFVSIVGIVVVHSSRFNTFKQSCTYIPRYVKFIHGLGRESVSDNSSAITREHRNVGWKCNNARRSNNEIGGRDIEAKDTTGEQN